MVSPRRGASCARAARASAIAARKLRRLAWGVRCSLLAIALAGCGAHASVPTGTLRAACGEAQWWDGTACVDEDRALVEEVEHNDARVQEDPDAALAAADAAAGRGPYDRGTYARIWRQRGMAHALLAYAAAAEAKDDPSVAEEKAKEQAAHEAAAKAAFDMLLALDPSHRLEYTQTPQTTFVFQEAIAEAAARPVPAIDVDWKRDLRVGDAIPVDVEVIADPKAFLDRATLFVRRRGEPTWEATDLELPDEGKYERVVLPAIDAKAATAVELYLRAYDQAGNEVLAWASEDRPREVPLRWEPPTPWYKKWWVWTIGASVVAGATGAIVYAAQWEPSDSVGGTVVAGR